VPDATIIKSSSPSGLGEGMDVTSAIDILLSTSVMMNVIAFNKLMYVLMGYKVAGKLRGARSGNDAVLRQLDRPC
jgi:uncharacterized protein YfeS